MAELLFRLSGVPEDEAEDVRQLLIDNHIDFYETHAGFWRLGVDALWLPSKDQLHEAKKLLQDYQQARFQEARQNKVDESFLAGLFRHFFQHPLHFLMSLFAVAVVLIVTLVPFLGF